MATWILGDIHGCSDELAALVDKLGLGSGDRVVACGDLFHRGPDPVGVMEQLQAIDALFVLGNHERALLRRIGAAPRRVDGSDRPDADFALPELDPDDIAGDGRTPCICPAERRAALVRFTATRHSGYVLRRGAIPTAGPNVDGRDWLVVHAGFVPGSAPESQSPDVLTGIRRLESRGRPWWYEDWAGPELVLFGHTHSPLPRAHSRGGRLVALGLDTGCVFGGSLSAYSPELDELVQVPALRADYAVGASS